MNYYNEFDPKAAAWLRELIRQKQIPEGVVDERSICEVQPNELVGYAQCHFFAGIGGWSLALRLAGVPDDEPLWTGSCPCQPFSAAGKQLGTKDERHLWPDFFRLIRECRPVRVFGEQVESAVRHGWLDGVSADLEAEGYAIGAIVLGAHSFGAPHIRQRLFWVAQSRSQPAGRIVSRPGEGSGENQSGASGEFGGSSSSLGLADAHGEQAHATDARGLYTESGSGGGTSRLGVADSAGRQPGQLAAAANGHWNSAESTGGDGSRMGSPIRPRLEGHAGHGDDRNEPGRLNARTVGPTATPGSPGHWNAFDLIPCRDGKARRIEPGTFPLAHGFPSRVDLLRGYGNAIVPQVAAEFIKAFYEVT